jgi:RNA polymerase sigma factor (sigma-70 family)
MPNDPTPLSDHALLHAYVTTGGQDAFAQLVARHVDLVYAAARRQLLGDDAHLAEDVTQAVFLMLATKARAGAIGPHVVLAGWLYNATRYAAANARKIEARRRHHERKGTLMTRPTHHAGTGAEESESTWSGIAPLLDAALARLAAPDRDAVLLKFIQGKSHRDVGAALGISDEAARKRVHRALGRLRLLLARRGVACPAATLAALLTTHASEAAPATLSAACGFAPSLAATASSTAITKGALSLMAWTKAKFAASLLAASALLTTTAAYTAHRLAAPAPRPVAQAPAAPRQVQAPVLPILDQPPAAPNLIEGTIVRPDGEPLVDVEVYLATPQNGLNLYTRKQRTRNLQVTEPDGKFSFPRPADDLWKIVAMTVDGVAEITSEDLANSPLVTLQPWGRIEGALYAAAKPIPNATVSVGEWGWGNDPLSMIVTSQTTVKTDKDGRFVVPRVPPGAPLLAHQLTTPTYVNNKWECVSVPPGQTIKVALGWPGRPVTARLAVPEGWQDKVPLKQDRMHYWDISARMLKPLDILGGINPQMGGMPMPPGWHTMTPRDQHFFRRNWERSPAGVAYRRHMFPDQTPLAPDGTVRFDSLRPGRYALNVRSLINVPDQSMLEDVAGGELEFTVPELPVGVRTDQPVNLGVIPLRPVPRIAPGDKAPPFRVATVDHKPIKLDDYKGKFLVLQMRMPYQGLADDQPALQKAHAAFAANPDVAFLSVHILLPNQPFKPDPNVKWPPATGIGLPESEPETPSLFSPSTWLAGKPSAPPANGNPPGYLRGPAPNLLSAPDGAVVTKILKPADVETAVAKAMLERK